MVSVNQVDYEVLLGPEPLDLVGAGMVLASVLVELCDWIICS